MKLNFRSSLIALSMGMFLLTSCNDNENDLIETNESSFQNEEEGLIAGKYSYKGKIYSKEALKSEYPIVFDIASMSYNYDEDTMYLFENDKEYEKYSAIINDVSARNPSNWGFKFRMWEHENYRGRFFEYKRTNLSGFSQRSVWTNVPSWINDKGSSIVVDEINFSFISGGAYGAHRITCYQDYNRGGRSVTATKFPIIFGGTKKTFSNLRKGDWNDKISSIQLSGR